MVLRNTKEIPYRFFGSVRKTRGNFEIIKKEPL